MSGANRPGPASRGVLEALGPGFYWTSDYEAGADSPHLDEREQTQAAEHAAPAAMVIHEIVREEGELELRRRNAALLWSGLAAGLSMGFSLLTWP